MISQQRRSVLEAAESSTVGMTEGALRIRCEWGESAASLLARESDVIVIVDVLSFCTCVDL